MIDSTQDTHWHANFKFGTSWIALNTSSRIASAPVICCLLSSADPGMLSRLLRMALPSLTLANGSHFFCWMASGIWARMGLWWSMAIRLQRKLRMGYPWWLGAREPVWPPNWERPYRIKCCAPGNTYILETLRGEEEFGRAIKWGIFNGILP